MSKRNVAVGLKGEWDALTTLNQFVATFVHPFHSKMSEVLMKNPIVHIEDVLTRVRAGKVQPRTGRHRTDVVPAQQVGKPRKQG